ncbi:hypothetical protein Gohar_018433, partial [Gossypium harknessii]|nr:hypothetical protein [Gossypium harknessii]
MEKEADRMVWRGVASGLYSVRSVEAFACVQAIRFGAGFGFLKVELEGQHANIEAHTLAKEGLKDGSKTCLDSGHCRGTNCGDRGKCR